MLIKSPTILAIDPGAKELGVAVLAGSHLEYFAVKTFKHRSPPQALLVNVSRYITKLIDAYQPTNLAIERTFLVQRNAALLNVAAAEIKHAARSRGLAVWEYAPIEVRKIICRQEKALKREAVQVIVKRFPELARFLRQPTQWEALYWAHMFDAVAVGLVCLEELSREIETEQN